MAPDPTSSAPAVRAATHRALAARELLVGDCPEWEAWRQEVHAVKSAMVSHWREHLARLTAEVEGWGGVVHFAREASEARAIILEVARRHQVRRVVQSKSMTAHEIGVAPFLARQGIELTETDLGEYIVQLAGDTPAHITAPALHLNRHQISRIFSKHWQEEVPSDPRELTRLAARRLAPRFAEAQLGITGVNFAGAAEGALVCLENEGNLRQTAVSPPVHLALMGWEKMVPTLAALEPGLRLLPASATGQRLTALVHFWRGLKDGPRGTQAFYLVVLDNGRSRLAAHPELREALCCLRCGACLNICPVFQAGAAQVYGRVYPGAIGILLAPYLPPVGDIADLCTQCGACGAICPAGIALPQKIRGLRRSSHRFRRVRAASAALGLVLKHPRLYRDLAAGARLAARELFAGRITPWLGKELSPESFWEISPHCREARPGGRLTPPPEGPRRAPEPLPSPAPTAGGRPSDPAAGVPGRFAEAGAVVLQAGDPGDLARHLAGSARGAISLEDHPSLTPVARELEARGVPILHDRGEWAPEVDTAVTVGLGAIPETGSVLVSGGPGRGACLPFRARRQVVVIPPGRADLRLGEALALVRDRRAAVTWLTGPTRTADIEKVLVLGAQGPEELEVVFSPGWEAEGPQPG